MAGLLLALKAYLNKDLGALVEAFFL